MSLYQPNIYSKALRNSAKYLLLLPLLILAVACSKNSNGVLSSGYGSEDSDSGDTTRCDKYLGTWSLVIKGNLMQLDDSTNIGVIWMDTMTVTAKDKAKGICNIESRIYNGTAKVRSSGMTIDGYTMKESYESIDCTYSFDLTIANQPATVSGNEIHWKQNAVGTVIVTSATAESSHQVSGTLNCAGIKENTQTN